MTIKERLEIIGKAIAFVSLLFSAIFFVISQWTSWQQQKYENTQGLIERYTDDGARRSEQNIAARLLYYTRLTDLNDMEKVTDNEFAVIAIDTLFGKPDAPANEPGTAVLYDLLSVTDFYERVAFCLKSGMCNRRLTEQFFCSKAASFQDENVRLLSFYATYARKEGFTDGIDAIRTACP